LWSEKLSFWDEWPKRRKRYPTSPFEEIDEIIQEMFKELHETFPKEFVKERRLSDGSTMKILDPIVYGYSMTIGPDGTPVIREFGHVRPAKSRARLIGPKSEEQIEPLIEVTSGEKSIQVVAEIPGVDKNDIKLNATEDTLVISVDAEKRKYYKEIELPEKANSKSAKTSYRNGVLEVTFDKLKREAQKGEHIRIE
jgi:HSP20 family protein